jgi:hypothetical protein
MYCDDGVDMDMCPEIKLTNAIIAISNSISKVELIILNLSCTFKIIQNDHGSHLLGASYANKKIFFTTELFKKKIFYRRMGHAEDRKKDLFERRSSEKIFTSHFGNGK